MIILLCVIHGVNGDTVQKQPSPKPNQQDSSELTELEHLLNDLNGR